MPRTTLISQGNLPLKIKLIYTKDGAASLFILIHSFNRYLLNSKYVLAIVLGLEIHWFANVLH